MPKTRSILIHGLGIALRRFAAFLWIYAFGLVLALAFSYPLKRELSKLLDNSMAAQRLATGFDIGTVLSAGLRLHEVAEGTTTISGGAIPAFLLIYILLVPGTLYCYIKRSPARLSTLLQQGVMYFWRFVRITLLTLLSFAIIIAPLLIMQAKWSAFVDERYVGRNSLILRLCGIGIVVLVASLVRLYFDLVEAYTVQLGSERRSDGRQDRRVRRTLRPAFRLLRDHLWHAWLIFLLLGIIGGVGSFLLSRTAVHMLAQQRVWPMFLVAQSGIALMTFIRCWQRGAEASLVRQHPLPFIREDSRIPFVKPSRKTTDQHLDRPQHISAIYNTDPLTPIYPPPLSADDQLATFPAAEPAAESDPIPNPEPPVPSLDEPDPGVFHHEPGTRQAHRSTDAD